MTAPSSHLRCHTAKSAYWMGSSGRGDGDALWDAAWDAAWNAV